MAKKAKQMEAGLQRTSGTYRKNRDKSRKNKQAPPQAMRKPGPRGAHGDRMWRVFLKYSAEGVIQPVDLTVLYAACQNWDLWCSLFEDLQQATMEKDWTEAGRINRVSAKALDFVFQMVRQFGGTPKSRELLRFDPGDDKAEEDIFKAFLDRAQGVN